MLAILSDIHGNLFALESVVNDLSNYPVENIILLGDLIDYGQQSNEVANFIKNELPAPVIVNLWGNHEQAIIQKNYTGFSSERGKESARYTASILNSETVEYLENSCAKNCKAEFVINGKKILAIHGSLENPAWLGITPENLHGDYQNYDIVFSGHTHYSHCFTKFYNSDAAEFRYKKSVLFINPGSVGQPRNHNPNAQYALIDTKNWSVYLRSVEYDINKAMSLFVGQVDSFYCERLRNGV